MSVLKFGLKKLQDKANLSVGMNSLFGMDPVAPVPVEIKPLASPWTVLLSDAFSGVDGTPINEHTPDIGTLDYVFSPSGGGSVFSGGESWIITANQLVMNFANPKRLGDYISDLTSDLYIQMSIYSVIRFEFYGGELRTFINWVDDGEGGYKSSGYTISLNGTDTGQLCVDGDLLRLEKIGTTLNIYKNGVLITTGTSDPATYSRNYFCMNSATAEHEMTIDNLETGIKAV
jgi:hypothetical protein